MWPVHPMSHHHPYWCCRRYQLLCLWGQHLVQCGFNPRH